MDQSLLTLCHALKTTLRQIKTHSRQALSCILLVGKSKQGKTALMNQSNLKHVIVDAQRAADIYYNELGIILDLGEDWLKEPQLLTQTLKKLNQCDRALEISGLMLCLDINEFFYQDAEALDAQQKLHVQLLKSFGQSLGRPIDLALIFTKLDQLLGFSDFFQQDHQDILQKPLGFSVLRGNDASKSLENYRQQFDLLVEALNQQVIHKIHPARSSLKRSLIREFPLQLASLKVSIQSLLMKIPRSMFHIEALYFTSAEQGGQSFDRLNKKIEQDYALVLQERHPQSHNYRAYFIQGAITAFQQATKRHLHPGQLPVKSLVAGCAALLVLSFSWMLHKHFKSSGLLDQASKELLLYEAMAQQGENQAPALYHLTKASQVLNRIPSGLALPTLQLVKTKLKVNAKETLKGNFLPSVLSELEKCIQDAQKPHYARYEALKIYLMFEEAAHYSKPEVLAWFSQNWQNEPAEQLQNKLALLKQILTEPRRSISIDQKLVNDTRNELNALPSSYLWYSLAKSVFPKESKKIEIPGFELAQAELPAYLTKTGFHAVIQSMASIAAKLKQEAWVLKRQDMDNLPSILQEAYCYEYQAWWQNFMGRSKPSHFQNYQQAGQLTEQLAKTEAIQSLIQLIQEHTGPEQGAENALFNQAVASKFTFLSLLSQSSMQDLSSTLRELNQFLQSIALVQDQGKTAFTLTKARFQGDRLTNPLSNLYARSQQLPAPVADWTKQLADDTWFMLIQDSRQYINQQWQQMVYSEYQNKIAKRYPFDAAESAEVAIADFEQFFAPQGQMNHFLDEYLKPFLDTSEAQWQPKALNGYVLPIPAEAMNEIIRANVISNMFFPGKSEHSKIAFSLQKLSLDPIVASLQLSIGNQKLQDSQNNAESNSNFNWPAENAKLSLNSIEGNHYELEEQGPWAFFKMLQKVNVLVDEQDSTSLEILFEVNGNSGRYILKAENKVNPFIPGILNGFSLKDKIV